ncbi:MAG: pyridoxal phosphate-dependent aminotransferase [Planctomycetota bacterium]|jgi:aspartate aminotransferase|nr:pyridoxal phosphate-dependent aminotransferase [Planctomycetota bacterium]MDP6520805.1 pyridoxal phosphate-dependent aminotransferase [Planctomycetota bacterium]MDP6837358.1 pyridoxal phosphate-dependent aminotransferase [Planctomycetota bacterium]
MASQRLSPNKLVSAISLSATLALDARAKALAASGADVVNMSVGEPDCDAPAAVQAAACAAVRGGRVRYTPAAGRVELRAAIASHVSRTRGIEVTSEEVTVCHSGKHALSGTLLTLIEPGDEVLLLLPAWISYVEQVTYAGGTPISVAPRRDCGPDFEAIAAAIGPRTRGIMLNSPSNPSGYVWSAAEIGELAELARERDLWLLSDEIYSRLVYEGEPSPSPASISDDARGRTIIVDGASKSYAMTGYRIGFVVAPEPIAAGVARLHSHLTGSPNAVSQDAYLAVLENEPPEVAEMVAEFAARRTLLIDGLRELGLEVPMPRGAFYAFPRMDAHLDERGSVGLCEDLLEEQRLATVPGAVFGLDQHIRLSYALARPAIEEALARLGTFLGAR